jgi:hypothetical protein
MKKIIASKPAHAADLAFGPVFSLEYSSGFRYTLESNSAQPARQLMRDPLGGKGGRDN